MCGRTVGIFDQAIFRSPLVGSDGRSAQEEVAIGQQGPDKVILDSQVRFWVKALRDAIRASASYLMIVSYASE